MIEIAIKDFARATKIVASAMERRNTIPILDVMRARANGRFEIEGTDLDMTARVSVPCEASSGQEFLIAEHRSTAAALGAAGGAKARFEVIGDQDKIQGYRVTAGALAREVRSACAIEDFPNDYATPASTEFSATLTSREIGQLRRITAAISTEETRYYLNGIHVQKVKDWTYRFAATDGHRLMTVDLPLPDYEGSIGDGMILPRKFLNAVFAHFAKAEGPITMIAGPGTAHNSTDGTAPPRASLTRVSLSAMLGNTEARFSSKTIDGIYPDYSRVIPQANDKKALFDISDLRRAINALAAGSFVWGVSPAIRLSFKGSDCVASLYYGIEGVRADYRIACHHNGGGLEIGFKAGYLLDCLNALKGPEVLFELADPAAPTIIRDPADPAFLSVLMPMRIDERSK